MRTSGDSQLPAEMPPGSGLLRVAVSGGAHAHGAISVTRWTITQLARAFVRKEKALKRPVLLREWYLRLQMCSD